MYVAPPGRYAHWVTWKLAGLTKEGWQAIHTIFSLAFLILSVFHLFIVNWKAFLSYLKSKTKKGLNKKREFYISTTLAFVFFFGVIFSVPPFVNIMDFGEYCTDSWEKREERAPIPHAELLTLNELAEQLSLPSVEYITTKLENHNIDFENTSTQTLQEIAEENNSTPIGVYEIISKRAGNQRQGSGIGRKTVEDFALEFDKSVEEIIKVLKDNNIEAKPDETLRDIGDNNNVIPREVYELISK